MSDTSRPNQLIVAGRRIVVRRGRRSQTVSVCTMVNAIGSYEARFRLSLDVDVAPEEVAQLQDLPALRDWLLARNAEEEGPSGTPSSRLPRRIPAPPTGDAWLHAAVDATERAITELVDEFVAHPYLHRVEHSLHARLFELLKQRAHLTGNAELRSGHRTQLIHKEWPETVARGGDENRRPRGLFDLAILAPSQIEQADLEQFSTGRIDPAIVIEVGLDYAFDHLRQDAEKVANSAVPHPYLVHLSRIATAEEAVETLVVAPATGCRMAYVHHDPRTGAVRSKHTGETEVQQCLPLGRRNDAQGLSR